jgi:hypothetical protein
MFCTNCGNSLSAGDTFCTECGQKNEEPAEPQAAVEPEAPAETPKEAEIIEVAPETGVVEAPPPVVIEPTPEPAAAAPAQAIATSPNSVEIWAVEGNDVPELTPAAIGPTSAPSGNRKWLYIFGGMLVVAGVLLFIGLNKSKKKRRPKLSKATPTATTNQASNQTELAKAKVGAEVANARFAEVEAAQRAAEARTATAEAMGRAAKAPKAAVDPCAHAALFNGRWRLTSAVRGVRKSAIGVNGYYTLQLKSSGCSVSGRIAKVGYTNKRFEEHQYQLGQLNFTATGGDAGSSGEASFNIARSDGSQNVQMRFYLNATAGQLSGFWMYEGSSFASAAFWGSFKAHGLARGSVSHSSHDYVGSLPSGFESRLNGEMAGLAALATHEVFDTYLDKAGETWLALRTKAHRKKGRSIAHMKDGTRLTILDTGLGYKRRWKQVKVMSGEHATTKGYAHGKWIRAR